MSFSSKTVPDLSSNVLKLSFMRPSLQAAEKSKIVKEDKNKLKITYPLPDRILKLINDSMKNVKNSDLTKKDKNLLIDNKLPRGARLSYGGFNLETEKQMTRKEINIDNYEEIHDPADDYTVSVEEMKEFAFKNRNRFNNKRQNDDIEEGEIVSEHKSKRKRI